MKWDLTLPAPAKINLFLHIVERREDGDHNLQTLFQFVDYGDTLHFKVSNDNHSRVVLNTDITPLQGDDNLIIKAAKLLQQHTGCEQSAIIQLDKCLPMGGGLGGGSSDAATTLLALNTLWQLQLSIDELATIGLELGADVPVFVRGHSAFAEGVGEQLTPQTPDENWLLIITPPEHVDTTAMFKHPLLTRDSKTIAISDITTLTPRNDFESLVRQLYPKVDKALSVLDNSCDVSIGHAIMSGSGASVFARFATQQQAIAAQQQFNTDYQAAGLTLPSSFVAQGINLSPCHTALQQATDNA